MGSYLLRRLMLMLLTLFGMSVLIFIALRLVPGNIADILVDSAGIVDNAQKLKIEHELGLDRSLIVQYGQWIGGLLQGDLGYAYISERPAIEEIAPRIPVTAKLATLALFFAVAIGVPLGVLSAVRHSSCRSAEPGPYRTPAFVAAPALQRTTPRRGGLLRCVRGTKELD